MSDYQPRRAITGAFNEWTPRIDLFLIGRKSGVGMPRFTARVNDEAVLYRASLGASTEPRRAVR